MSTGSGAGGGDGAKVWSFSSIMEVTLWIVVGEEWESQGDAPSTAVCGSGMRAGRGTTSWMQGICVCWDCTGGCGLLVILLSGCRGAFSSQLSSWENCELAFLSSLMTRRTLGHLQSLLGCHCHCHQCYRCGLCLHHWLECQLKDRIYCRIW